jgi:hypothetical protein
MYLGGFTITSAPTPDGYLSSFDRFEAEACRHLDLAHVYLRWTDQFPSQVARTLVARRHYLLVSWTGTDLAAMASGSLDAEITARARQIAALHAPVFLELRWEMDRPNLAREVHSPATYIAAWRHVRALFQAADVHNVSWVWCPTSSGFATGRAQAYYPGDDEVDWVCADAYPALVHPDAPYPSFASLIQPFMNWTKSHDKPVMIGEFGIPQSYSPSTRAAWIDAADQALAVRPRIKAVGYFDGVIPGTPPSLTFALGSSPVVLHAFRRLADDPRLRARG